MKKIETEIPEVFLLEPKVFGDQRGFFYESFNRRVWQQLTGLDIDFVQNNHSKSSRGVLRGLHYQIRQAQGKLVRVVEGAAFDVAVDLRRSSPTFGKWVGRILSEENKYLFWVPPGFAHGFLALTDDVQFLYMTTEYYAPEHERCICWDDPDLGVAWPTSVTPVLSEKDGQGIPFAEAEVYD